MPGPIETLSALEFSLKASLMISPHYLVHSSLRFVSFMVGESYESESIENINMFVSPE
jgi:hypothetical protein